MTKGEALKKIDAHIKDVAQKVLSGDPSLEHSWGDHHARELEYFWLIFHENFDPDGGLIADYAVAVLGCDPAEQRRAHATRPQDSSPPE